MDLTLLRHRVHRVGEGHPVDLRGKRRIDDEPHRELPFLVRAEMLRRETEALRLLQVAGGVGGRDARDRLPRRRVTRTAADPELRFVEPPGDNGDRGGRGHELPVAPRAITDTSSSVISRGAAAVWIAPDGSALTRMPAISQITSYSGTSAKPNAKLPAAISSRRRLSEAFRRRVPSSIVALRAGT